MIKIKHYPLVLAAAALLLPSCSGESSNSQTVEEKSVTVSVKELQKQDIMRVLTLSSVLQPYEKVAVAPALQGRITNLYVEVGQNVSKGQLVAKMDETQYLSTKLNYENSKNDFNRIKILNDSNNIEKQLLTYLNDGRTKYYSVSDRFLEMWICKSY